jgi:hypothetical protein
MREMFSSSLFNQAINNWNVSNVTNMIEMFRATPFNQAINSWCVTKIPTEPVNFSLGSPLTQQNKPIWGSCPGN